MAVLLTLPLQNKTFIWPWVGRAIAQRNSREDSAIGPLQRCLAGHAAGPYSRLLTLLKARISTAEERHGSNTPHVHGPGSTLWAANSCLRFKHHKPVPDGLHRWKLAEASVPGLAPERGHEPCFCMANFMCFGSRDKNTGNSFLSFNQREQGCVLQTVEQLLLHSLYTLSQQRGFNVGSKPLCKSHLLALLHRT